LPYPVVCSTGACTGCEARVSLCNTWGSCVFAVFNSTCERQSALLEQHCVVVTKELYCEGVGCQRCRCSFMRAADVRSGECFESRTPTAMPSNLDYNHIADHMQIHITYTYYAVPAWAERSLMYASDTRTKHHTNSPSMQRGSEMPQHVTAQLMHELTLYSLFRKLLVARSTVFTCAVPMSLITHSLSQGRAVDQESRCPQLEGI
jgi:hypothetical protein